MQQLRLRTHDSPACSLPMDLWRDGRVISSTQLIQRLIQKSARRGGQDDLISIDFSGSCVHAPGQPIAKGRGGPACRPASALKHAGLVIRALCILAACEPEGRVRAGATVHMSAASAGEQTCFTFAQIRTDLCSHNGLVLCWLLAVS